MNLTVDHRVVIVTGAASGIGRAAAHQLAQGGAHVVVSDLNPDAARDSVQAITDTGGSASAVAGDISEPSVVEQVVTEATRHGPLKGLVNNAGVMDLFAGAAETDDATWERCLRVNLTAPFLLTRAVLPHMLAAGTGSIVNVASEAGLRGGAAGAAYTASKHGAVGLTRSTAFMYAKRGIRTNAVLPGGVSTNIMSSIDPAHIDQGGLETLSPIHHTAIRTAEPEELAALIVFLLADESGNVNGALIPSDGGWSAG